MKKAAAFVLFAILLAVPAHGANLGDMVMERQLESMKEGGVGPVVFPHTAHEKLLKCADCHPKIFTEKRGANDVSMKKNMEQKFCGSPNCHNSPKAFPLFMCAKCHTQVKTVKPRNTAPKKK